MAGRALMIEGSEWRRGIPYLVNRRNCSVAGHQHLPPRSMSARPLRIAAPLLGYPPGSSPCPGSDSEYPSISAQRPSDPVDQ